MSDKQLQREFAVARQIHAGMRGESREVVLPAPPDVSEQGRKMAIRISVAFMVLMFVNVGIGLWFIFKHESNNPNRPLLEAQMREKIAKSIERAATLTPAAAMRWTWMKESFGAGVVVGTILTILELRKEWHKFLPSPTGMGIAMLIPFSAVTMIFLGAVLDRIWKLLKPDSHERYSIPIASGLIAGEALVAVIIPLLVTLHLMKLPS